MEFFTFVGLPGPCTIYLIKGQKLCQECFNKSCINLALNNTSHLLIILKVKVPEKYFSLLYIDLYVLGDDALIS